MLTSLDRLSKRNEEEDEIVVVVVVVVAVVVVFLIAVGVMVNFFCSRGHSEASCVTTSLAVTSAHTDIF